ncbi:hypothetical protein CYY_007731 [Polysphondylium violaceum]|uniref:BAR domain-containing protein n=1 Tax=Polysphondylium violaceum TaxID=133409 RepID=A0A8J4PPB9_9MYCE|nr:hypothetical protein CYY_007731 [Polysphondylium violaceum]
MSATRERTREVFGFKKENTEKPETALYRQEVNKLKNDYKQLEFATRTWMESLSKLSLEGELLSQSFKAFGGSEYHREGESLVKIGEYLDRFNITTKGFYERIDANVYMPINDTYLFCTKNIDTQETKLHQEKLKYDDAMTLYTKPQFHETEIKTREREGKKNTAQALYFGCFDQYEQQVSDLEVKTEKDIPRAFRNLINEIHWYFETGMNEYNNLNLPSGHIEKESFFRKNMYTGTPMSVRNSLLHSPEKESVVTHTETTTETTITKEDLVGRPLN